MRLLWVIAALAALTLAENLSERDMIMRVLKGWKPHSQEIVDHSEHQDSRYMYREQAQDSHHRSKRSIPVSQSDSGFLSASKACQTPGYTGEFCENPVCGQNNGNVPDIPNTDDLGASIDAATLANCTQKYVTLVDDTMWFIHVEIESEDNVNPTFYLMGEDGTVYAPSEVQEQSATRYAVIFFQLTPGQYVVGPSADVKSTYCQLFVRAKTTMTLEGGFTYGGSQPERSDYPMDRYAYYRELMPLVAHTNRLRNPGRIVTVNFVGEDNSVVLPKLMRPRYNCSYEYLYESFYCRTTGYYYFQVEGIDFMGNHFRRIKPFICIMPPATTTPKPVITTVTPTVLPTSCQNNGVLVTNLDSTTYCYCLGLWSGPLCNIPLCMNGGRLTDNNKCECEGSTYNGNHCENIICEDDAGFGFDINHPTLTFVIRTRAAMKDVINQVVNATQTLITTLQFDPTYLQSFTLVLFNNNTATGNSYGSATEFIQALQAAALSTATGPCTDAVFAATASAMSSFLTNKSPVYVITDALPNDYSEVETVFALDSFWRLPLTFIYIETSITDACQPSVDDPGFRMLDRLAQRTGGIAFYVNNRANVGPLLQAHMLSTVYRSQLLLSNDLLMCGNQNVYKSVAIDISIQQIVIVAKGKNIGLYVTTPEGNNPTFDSVYNDGTNFIWIKNGPHSGNWLFNFLASNPNDGCSFKIYQKSYHNIAATSGRQYDLFWGFTAQLNFDMGLYQPLYNFDSAIVMHLTQYPPLIPPERVHAGLTIYSSRGGNQTEVYASNGIWRDGCTYHFYFPPFTCRVPDETLYFNFFARDQLGMAIQRAGTMYCYQFQPTQPPAPGACQNGGALSPNNSTCYCQPGYSGPLCQTISCYNGGTPAGSFCQCPSGWGGDFCNIATCIQKGPTPEFLRLFVDMVFAVEMTVAGQAQLAVLNQNFADLIRDVQSQNPRWIQRYILVGFNSTWGDVLAVSPAFDPSIVISTMNQIANTVYTDKACVVQLWQSLEKAVLKGDTQAGSYVQIFITSPPDVSPLARVDNMYDFSRDLDLQVNAFLSFAINSNNPNGYFCNGTDDAFTTLFDISGGSAGTVYPIAPGYTSDIIRVIPLQFSNGVVYGRSAVDCTGEGLQVYFPVDAYAQTIQLNIVAYNADISLIDGNGNPHTMFPLMTDPGTGWTVQEYRKECDTNGYWYKVGQYCVLFDTTKKTWSEAQAFCHAAGGSLVDDLSNTKHNYLMGEGGAYTFWTGLYNNGSGYMWDRPNGVPPLPLGTPTFWNGGTAPPYNANASCVYFDPTADISSSWNIDNCNVQRAYACQKHQYDQNHRPNDISDNDLPAGKWMVSVTAHPNGTQPPICFVKVMLQSNLQIVTGFTTDIHSDFPVGDPVVDSVGNRIMTYVHSLDNTNRIPILTHALLWDAYNGTFYNAATYQIRFGCAYYWISQDFACPNAANPANEFGIAHIGEDEFGNAFQRVTFAHCHQEEILCNNGGVRSNGSCVCNDYWQGVYCTVPICVNGGTLNNDKASCTCLAGFTGRNCELDLCTTRSPASFSPNGKTLLLVVEATTRNADAFNQLATNLTGILSAATSTNPIWIDNYGLVLFDSTGPTFTNLLYTDPSAIQTKLKATTLTDPGTCLMPIYAALGAGVNTGLINSPNSEILLFTASGASDLSTRENTVSIIADLRAHLTWLYTNNTACGAIPADQSFPHLARLAYATSGNLFFMNSGDLSPLLSSYLPTLFGASSLHNPTMITNFTCGDGDNWYVEVDRNTTSIFITSYSQYGTVVTINPLGLFVAPTVLWTDNMNAIYEVDTSQLPGIYTVTLTSPGPCFAHIYSVGGAMVYPQFAAVSTNDPNGAHTDGNTNTPFNGVSNIATFHLDGPFFHRGILLGVTMVDATNGKLALRSDLYRRAGCSYEYYSDPFPCVSDFLMVLVYGVDEFSAPFRRIESAYCRNGTFVQPTGGTTINMPPSSSPSPASSQPPVTQPPASSASTAATPPSQPPATSAPTAAPVTSPTVPVTQVSQGTPAPTSGNANMIFDVVYLIDVTSAAQNLLNDMTKFITTLMISYTIGLSNVRVAIIPVFATDDEGTTNVANLNSIGSQANLNAYLSQVGPNYGDFGSTGQAINLAIGGAVDPNFIASGYRTNITNHLIVYITATNKFTDDPTAAAENVLTTGTYGFVSIGYGPGVTDITNLQGISGGNNCAFMAPDVHTLNTQTLAAVQNLITAANSNGGKYCGM